MSRKQGASTTGGGVVVSSILRGKGNIRTFCNNLTPSIDLTEESVFAKPWPNPQTCLQCHCGVLNTTAGFGPLIALFFERYLTKDQREVDTPLLRSASMLMVWRRNEERRSAGVSASGRLSRKDGTLVASACIATRSVHGSGTWEEHTVQLAQSHQRGIYGSL